MQMRRSQTPSAQPVQISVKRHGDSVALSSAGTATGDEAPHMPGELGVWLFILGDMMVFALFFCTFMYYRGLDSASFRAGQAQLNRNLGVLNTFLLLTSSWLVALAVQAVRKRQADRAPLLFGAAGVCACGFITVKVFEYSAKLQAGITPASSDFFLYYYVFTGIHLLHVVVGLALLVWLTLRSRHENESLSELSLYESGASYWHMVDLLWVVLFPLIYLMK